MENQTENQPQQNDDAKDNSIGGVQTNTPDPEAQNDTGYEGTTNAVSENHQDKDGYKLAVEDTMIGYNGDDAQLDMDLGDENDKRRSGNSGADDNG
jgi:hypothetical protein